MSLPNTMEWVIPFVSALPGVDPEAVQDALHLHWHHRRLELLFEKHLETLGLSPRRLEILELLYCDPDGATTPAELADAILLTRASITGNLDALERDGYIHRVPHPSDRRMVRIELTPDGRDRTRALLDDRYRKAARVVACLSAPERQQMLGFYQRLYRAVSDVIEEEATQASGTSDEQEPQGDGHAPSAKETDHEPDHS